MFDKILDNSLDILQENNDVIICKQLSDTVFIRKALTNVIEFIFKTIKQVESQQFFNYFQKTVYRPLSSIFNIGSHIYPPIKNHNSDFVHNTLKN